MKNKITIEQLRFAIHGDDTTSIKEILFHLIVDGIDSFGDSAHYITSSYNDMLRVKLLDAIIKQQAKSTTELLQLSARRLNFKIVQNYADDESINYLNYIYLDTDDIGTIKIEGKKLDNYNADDAELNWARRCFDILILALNHLGWSINFNMETLEVDSMEHKTISVWIRAISAFDQLAYLFFDELKNKQPNKAVELLIKLYDFLGSSAQLSTEERERVLKTRDRMISDMGTTRIVLHLDAALLKIIHKQ